MDFKTNIKIAFEAIKKANLLRLLSSNSIIKFAPSYDSALQFYLMYVISFSHSDFSLKALTSDLFLFVGIFCLNCFFKDLKRSSFLKISGFLYITSNLLLILLLSYLRHVVQLHAVALVLIYTSYQTLLYEIFTVPIISAFLEICPPNLESFFMGMFFFINNASKNFGNVIGSLLTWLWDIKSGNMVRINDLIFVHFFILLIGYYWLFRSFIPDNKVEPSKHRRKLDYIEMQDVDSIIYNINDRLSYVDIAEDYINDIYNESFR